jgi:cystathionine beta-lyase
VFDRAELRALAELAVERDLVVVSDEIHADLVHPGATHVPFASLGDDVAARTITLTSATKAFNIAGVRCAVLHTSSPSLRERLAAVPPHVLGAPSAFGLVATAAAWERGDAWLAGTMALLTANRDRVTAFLAERLPEIGYVPPEATYLAWLDCSPLPLDAPPVDVCLAGGVALNAGADFGPRSHRFVRLNFATPPEVLDLVLERMAAALGR